VRGTYDRYDYLAEKQEAFEKLSAAVESIVGEGNVVATRAHAWKVREG
jgi:hypothetical protein